MPTECEFGHEVVSIGYCGAVRPTGYVRDFARQHEVPEVCENLDDTVSAVGAAVIHGCDRETRVDRARPLVEAGKGVLLDYG